MGAAFVMAAGEVRANESKNLDFPGKGCSGLREGGFRYCQPVGGATYGTKANWRWVQGSALQSVAMPFAI